MNEIPLHPAIVHIPLGLAFVLPLVTLVALAISWRKKQMTPWIFVLVLNALMACSAWYSAKTGEEVEEVVEEYVGDDPIHAHEEWAERFVILAFIGTAVAAGATLAPIRKVRLGFGAASAVLAFGLAGFGVATGKTGGSIVHEHGVAWANPTGSPVDSRGDHDEEAEHDDQRDEDD